MRGRKPGEDFRGEPGNFRGKQARDVIWLKDVNFREWLSYDLETGIFRWIKSNGGKAYVGAVAGRITDRGYVQIKLGKVEIQAHRLAWWFCHGNFPKHEIDHINGNKADNRISNLREATSAQNKTSHGIKKTNTSGVTGISWDKKNQRWEAKISVNGRQIALGRFNDKNDAAIARAIAEMLCHGEFAAGRRTNLWICGISEWRGDTRNKKFLMTPILCDGSEGPVVGVTKIWEKFKSEEPVE